MTNLPPFNGTVPPKMADTYDPDDPHFEFPSESEAIEIASITFKATDDSIVDLLHPLMQSRKLKVDKYILKHNRKWSRTSGPETKSINQEISMSRTEGTSRTDTQAMKKALSVTGGGGFGPFSAEISASLEINTSRTIEWHEVETITMSGNYELGVTYAEWVKVEIFELWRILKKGDPELMNAITSFTSEYQGDSFVIPSDNQDSE